MVCRYAHPTVAIALLVVEGCTTPAEHLTSAPVVSSAHYTCLNDLVRRHRALVRTDELTGVFSAQLGDRRVAVSPGIAAAAIGARLVALGDEVVIRYGRVYVPRGLAHDIERYLEAGTVSEPPIEHDGPTRPPKEPQRPAPRTVGRVCVDPGHGGKDPGASSRALHEKDLVLVTSRLLAAELRSRNFDVTMTREGDFFVELEERPAIAGRRGADIFVSIHANSIRDPSFQGIEIFYCNSRRSAASASVQRESLELVDALRDAFRRAGLTVRKVQNRDLRVLCHARVPSALVEIGYMSNRADEQALRTTAYRQRVARAIADAIVAYRGGSK